VKKKNRAIPWLLCVFLLLFPAAAPAWNAAGHRLIAALAWKEMRVETRAKASALLKHHPDYMRWRTRQREADVDYGVFLEAAIWPDEIRHDPRFHDANAPPTPPLPGFPDMMRHQDWHFRNEPGAQVAGEIDTRLVKLARDLEDVHKAVYALPWFLHLVGDIHQPLHVGGRADRGGNGFTITRPENPGKPISLHAYWDALPGPPWLRQEALARELTFLENRPPPAEGMVADWMSESAALLETEVYPVRQNDAVQEAVITPEFHARARAITRERLAAAGIRLGRWLNRLL
jgi:hypothetical protein